MNPYWWNSKHLSPGRKVTWKAVGLPVSLKYNYIKVFLIPSPNSNKKCAVLH